MSSAVCACLAVAFFSQVAAQNVRPQIGYVYPPVVVVGQTTDVFIGGYDWTSDVEVFPHDKRVVIERTGEAGETILTPPPYWFGQKAGAAQPPLPREWPARITLPADLSPGEYRWQVASANGGSAVSTLVVSDLPQYVEPEQPAEVVDVPSPPLGISGRLSRITEIDRYRFAISEPGLVHVRLENRLGQMFRALLSIRDEAGNLVVEQADTTGQGIDLVWDAPANARYTATLHEIDWGGDRGYVYHLSVTRGPRVVATLPPVVARGGKQPLELIGWGLNSGKARLESFATTLDVSADAGKSTFTTRVKTPHGEVPVTLPLADEAQTLAASHPMALTLPATISAAFDAGDPRGSFPTHRYTFEAVKGATLRFEAEAARFQSPVDPTLIVLDAEGQELARADDLPNSTDAGLEFKAPADGSYALLVLDVSGANPSRRSLYRLVVDDAEALNDFTVPTIDKVDAPIGDKFELPFKIARIGKWKGNVQLSVEGLPAGVTVAEGVEILDGKLDAKIPFEVGADVGSGSSFVTIHARATIGERTVEHTVGPILLSKTLKTRCKVMSAVQDGGRIVNRGTTYPAEVVIERLEGYEGPVLLRMGSIQSRQRRGIRGGDLLVAAGVERTFYPVQMPEWLETSLTCRINVIGVTEIADPQGRVRQVTGVMDGLIVMSMEGALMKLSHEPAERIVRPGVVIEIPIRVARNTRLAVPATVEWVSDPALAGLVECPAITLAASTNEGTLRVKLADDARLAGHVNLTFRATALQDGKYPATSETTVPLVVERPTSLSLKP